jgi:hypothetical protein
MELAVVRKLKQPLDTIGILYDNDKKQCNTLELAIPNDGNYTHGFCIAPDRYEAIIVDSEVFDFPVLKLLDVPGGDNVEMHPGNDNKATHGCILTGDYSGIEDWIGHSNDEFNVLMDIVTRAVKERGERIWVTVTEELVDTLI